MKTIREYFRFRFFWLCYWTIRSLWATAYRVDETWPYTSDGIPLCENCCAGDLETEACPNDKSICVYCCPCHRDEEIDHDPVGGVGMLAGIGLPLSRYSKGGPK